MSDQSEKPKTADSAGGDRLFPEFSFPSYDEWYEQAVASLKGEPFEKKVLTKTYEGIQLKPMYWPEDMENLAHMGTFPGFPPYVRGTEVGGYIAKPWDICQSIPGSTPEEFNRIALHDLERGQTALTVVLDRPTRLGLDPDQAAPGQVGKGGLSLSTLEDLEKAFQDIDLERFSLMIDGGTAVVPILGLFCAMLRKRGASPQVLHGCIGADPVAQLVMAGSAGLDTEAAYDGLAAAVSWSLSHAPKLRTILVDAGVYHNAGASSVQELGFATAAAVETMRALTKRGLEPGDIARKMQFSFSVGSNFFMEIAKLRAARAIWSQVVSAFGGDDEACKMVIHARTSSYNKTACDPFVNMLRNTAETFSAAMGGAAGIEVVPFDEPVRNSDEFSRRVSRNLQIVLQEECHFTHPIDPAGGSRYVEVLTDALGEKAWALFQDVESRGGMLEALKAGMPQETLGAVAGKKQESLAVRKDVMVGTNMYANMLEKPLEKPVVDYERILAARVDEIVAYRSRGDRAQLTERLADLGRSVGEGSATVVESAAEAVPAGATLGDLTQAMSPAESKAWSVDPLRIHRLSEPFEELRARAEQYLQKTGNRMKVFLANMGPVTQHKARADFSTGFFEVGGFEVISNLGHSSVEEAADAALASGAHIVVICSTDKTYPDIVPPLAGKIKAARPEVKVVLAGKPASEYEQSYREAGMDDYIHIRSNCLQVLTNLQKAVGGLHG